MAAPILPHFVGKTSIVDESPKPQTLELLKYNNDECTNITIVPEQLALTSDVCLFFHHRGHKRIP
jgi:hypothetical protein